MENIIKVIIYIIQAISAFGAIRSLYQFIKKYRKAEYLIGAIICVAIFFVIYYVNGYFDAQSGKENNDQEIENEYLDDISNTLESSYLAEISRLHDRYGVNLSWEDGVGYVSMLDIDNNGIQELICVYNQRLLVYTYENSDLKHVIEEKIGHRFGNTDVCDIAYISTFEGQTWIVVSDSDETTEENITAYTLDNGYVRELSLGAISTIEYSDQDETFISPDEGLSEFWINYDSVSGEEYFKMREMLFKGDIAIIDAWDGVAIYQDIILDTINTLLSNSDDKTREKYSYLCDEFSI